MKSLLDGWESGADITPRLPSNALGSAAADGQGRYHQGPAVEQHVDADKKSDDPEGCFGPFPPDQDPEDESDDAIEKHPPPAVEAFAQSDDDAEQPAHEKGGREHEREERRGREGPLDEQEPKNQVHDPGQQVHPEAAPAAPQEGVNDLHAA